MRINAPADYTLALSILSKILGPHPGGNDYWSLWLPGSTLKLDLTIELEKEEVELCRRLIEAHSPKTTNRFAVSCLSSRFYSRGHAPSSNTD